MPGAMSLLIKTATLLLMVYIGWVAFHIDGYIKNLVHLSERRTSAVERCEMSMHEYLDSIVIEKQGVQERYAPVLDVTEYP